ncbi:acetylserotonin O-methyltransferase-like isoform X2 [Protopterus annectens]|uniref:acetylserotonin O-methyltransferase-like isoform X2 n=1 Tax=Protopterus annectens TaxID=7888 RepID=UPI001CFBE0A1|nr:acetylserotonin O-methyltransferase-like isoform X2 [Protopterus annectens]
MSTSDDTEFPHKIIDYMLGFLASKALFSASELGVFDILLNSKTPLSCADIAEQACCTVDGMDKLLTACAGLKLLRRTQKNGKCLYSNTHHSQLYLGKSSPKSLYPMGKYMSSTMYLLSHYMDDSVREGKPNYDKLCEMDCKDIFGFKSIYRSEEETFKFLGFMDCIWKVCGNEVVTAFDLSQFNNICDIGGNFFKDPLPEAELYILARILHDWKDDECLFLLKNLYKSCKPGGAILIIETVMNEHKSGPFQSLLFTLMMLIATAGMERTTCEYSKLLKTAGFQNIETGKTGKLYNAILARKLT